MYVEGFGVLAARKLGSERIAVFLPSGPNGFTVRGSYDPHRIAFFYR
jgi:hypothetical protein